METTNDPKSTAQRMYLPEELVNYWYENALNLANIKSKKGNPRLFSIDSSTHLKPAMLDSAEELHAVTYFFEHLQKIARKKPTQIAYVLNVFLNRVTASHSGMIIAGRISINSNIFTPKLRLFPHQFWHLLGQDLGQFLDKKKQPLLVKLAKSSTTDHPTTQEEFPQSTTLLSKRWSCSLLHLNFAYI